MADLSSNHRQTWWRSARAAVIAIWRWSPNFSPATYRLLKLGAIGAFAVDVGFLMAVHYGWLGAGWTTVRRVEDAGATFLMAVWISQAVRSRRAKREGRL